MREWEWKDGVDKMETKVVFTYHLLEVHKHV